MIFLQNVKYWWYRNMPWYISITITFDELFQYKRGEVFYTDTWKSKDPRYFAGWMYCGNNIFILVKGEEGKTKVHI